MDKATYTFKEVIKFIRHQQKVYIYVSDFTNFFDNLNHTFLKQKVKEVLNTNSLPDDLYNVFKSVTKYSYIKRDRLESILEEEYSKRYVSNLNKYFNSGKEFREFKKFHINRNMSDRGIPQGAGTSSVLSNIYMLDFDYTVNKYVKERGGIYRRYSDDLIIVIPLEKDTNNITIYNEYQAFVKDASKRTKNLVIQDNKTNQYFYNNDRLINLENGQNEELNYLGFSFNGFQVRIRDKSVFKFYNRAYRKVKLSNKRTAELKRKSHRKSLYEKYTHLGKNNGQGNFLDYATKAQKEFDKDVDTENLMERQVKRHWRKINKSLK